MSGPAPSVQPSQPADQVYAVLHQSITNGLEETGLAVREPHKCVVAKGFSARSRIQTMLHDEAETP